MSDPFKRWTFSPTLGVVIRNLSYGAKFGKIVPIYGPTSSGKRQLCRAAFEMLKTIDTNSKLSYFDCLSASAQDAMNRIESSVLTYRNPGSRSLLEPTARESFHYITIANIQFLKAPGIQWLLTLKQETSNVCFIVTCHRDLGTILKGGLFPPADFVQPVVLKDWTSATVGDLWSSWPEPWPRLALRLNAGDDTAVKITHQILEICGGRLGQLQSFADAWTGDHLEHLGFKSKDLTEFPITAIQAVGEFIYQLRDNLVEKKKGKGRVDHLYISQAAPPIKRRMD
jgi:hypothetical protein